MDQTQENVASLRRAYQRWHDTRGGSVQDWLDLMADDVAMRSLPDGGAEMPFTKARDGKAHAAAYFGELVADWEMIHYTTNQFVANDDVVVMRGSTAWRHRKTGREVDTPKADFVTFRDGKIVEFYEFYDTAALLAALQA